MTSFTLADSMLHVIAIHESSSRVIACVNKEWAQAVNVVISELRRRFLSSDITVRCLGLATLDDFMAEHRLQRVVRMFRIQVGNHGIVDLALWWYRKQLCLHHAISCRCNMSVQRILRRCYVFQDTVATTSASLKMCTATVLQRTLTNLWKLGFSGMQATSKRETWGAPIWVDP